MSGLRTLGRQRLKNFRTGQNESRARKGGGTGYVRWQLRPDGRQFAIHEIERAAPSALVMLSLVIETTPSRAWLLTVGPSGL
jgi:hypothetical protein